MEDQVKSAPPKKKMRAIFIAAIVLIAVGSVAIAYPFILSAQSYALKNRVNDEFEAGLQIPLEYEPVDYSSFPMADGLPLWKLSGDLVSGENVIPAPMPGWESLGTPEAQLVIPDINVKCGVFKADTTDEIYVKMRGGVSLYPGSPLPGVIGNTAIAGHRTGPSDFFRDLDKLITDQSLIYYHTSDYSYEFTVERVYVSEANNWHPVNATSYPALTLTTCQAEGGVSNAKRLIVRAKMTGIALMMQK